MLCNFRQNLSHTNGLGLISGFLSLKPQDSFYINFWFSTPTRNSALKAYVKGLITAAGPTGPWDFSLHKEIWSLHF